VGEDSNEALPLLPLPAARTERIAVDAFVAAESALDLPALTVSTAVRSTLHLPSILRRRPLARAVHVASCGNDRGADAKLVAAQRVVVFGIVALVTE